MNRTADLGLAILILPAVALISIAVAVAVKLTSPGPIIYWSTRIGRDNRHFRMPKFRSMRTGTPAVATHLLKDASSALTPIGAFLRRTSLDELPQLWSVLKGDMSFVGPRPALYNQDDLIALRTAAGISQLRPGITGWAQIRGRDELEIPQKVALEREYLERRSLRFDLRILTATVSRLFGDESVSH